MSASSTVTLILDRRLLRHPRAYHLRRMRMGVWLYLDLLSRLPGEAVSLEVDPALIARDMGVEEGSVRSWLGHLRKAGYVTLERLNGLVRVTIRRDRVPEESAPRPERFFSVAKLERALGESSGRGALAAALEAHSDAVIRRALAGALAVPGPQIRRSRTALFLYLLSRYAHA